MLILASVDIYRVLLSLMGFDGLKEYNKMGPTNYILYQ